MIHDFKVVLVLTTFNRPGCDPIDPAVVFICSHHCQTHCTPAVCGCHLELVLGGKSQSLCVRAMGFSKHCHTDIRLSNELAFRDIYLLVDTSAIISFPAV